MGLLQPLRHERTIDDGSEIEETWYLIVIHPLPSITQRDSGGMMEKQLIAMWATPKTVDTKLVFGAQSASNANLELQ